VPPADELDYTRHRIGVNFSNYSAWHYRTYLLPRVHAAAPSVAAASANAAAAAQPVQPPVETAAPTSAAGTASPLPLATLRGELELLRQAVFTEPDDQSPWFYRRWVLAQLERHLTAPSASPSSSPPSSEARDEAARLLQEDVGSLRELAALEPASKWPLLGIAQALAVLQRAGLPAEAAGAGADGTDGGPAFGSLRQLYDRLAGMDAMHAAYYRHCAGQLPPGE
jgi:geranylgeranyl transferase type-2 subunit alpha